MALQKQKFTLNLIQGTDTKTNDQIDTSFKDMVNVVFDGDLTAKKMNGYDVAGSLPPSEYYSGIFTQGNELLTQSEKGTYKFFEQNASFSKIDNIGSTSVDKVPSYGEFFCAGAYFNLHVGFITRSTYTGGVITYNNSYVYTFTDKNGAVLNTVEKPVVISVSDDEPTAFKFLQIADYSSNSTSGNYFFVARTGANSKLYLDKYSYDVGTNTFTSSASVTFDGTGGRRSITWINMRSLDIYTDGQNLFMAVLDSGASSGEFYKIDFSTLSTLILNTTYAGAFNQGSLKIIERDSSTLWLGWCSWNDTVGVITAYLIVNVHNKSDLVQTLQTIVAAKDAEAANGKPFYSYKITSDATAKYFFSYSYTTSVNGASLATPGYTFDPFIACNSWFGTGSGGGIANDTFRPGVAPVGDVFEENGSYFALVLCSIGNTQTYHVVNIDNGAPVATFDYSAASPIAGTQIYNYNFFHWSNTLRHFYTLKKMYKENGVWYLPTKPKVDAQTQTNIIKTSLRTIDFSASKINQQLEMVGKSNIFNGQPAYYDGADLSELGFLQSPLIMGMVSDTTGGFLSNGTYQVLAIYRYQDASGDMFHSALSNISGATVPLVLSGGTSTQRLRFILYTPLISTKNNVEVMIYVKKGSDQFALNQSFFITPGNGLNSGPFDVYVKTYSTAISGSTIPDYYLYANGTFAAGGDYPTAPLPDSVAAAIYEDRVFTISRDDQNSIAYSQQRLQGYGLEFSKDIFYIDVYDKRGVYEDKLTSMMAMDGRLFIFKERSILYIVGSGPSRANTQNDLSSPQLVTTDVGCIAAKSLVLVPEGIMFMSDKGIYLLTRKLQVEYLGSAVERFNANTVTSAVLLEKVNEVRFTTLEGELLIYNYLSKAWSWFTDLPAAGACIWKGKYTLLLTDGRVLTESSTHKKIIDGVTQTEIVQTISTPWLRLDGEQGWEKVYEVLVLGTYKSPHQLKASVYYDYELYTDEEYLIDPLDASDYNLTVKPTNNEIESGVKTNGVYQFRIDMIRKNCQAFRIVVQDVPADIAK
jgi:hypothetical protein